MKLTPVLDTILIEFSFSRGVGWSDDEPLSHSTDITGQLTLDEVPVGETNWVLLELGGHHEEFCREICDAHSDTAFQIYAELHAHAESLEEDFEVIVDLLGFVLFESGGHVLQGFGGRGFEDQAVDGALSAFAGIPASNGIAVIVARNYRQDGEPDEERNAQDRDRALRMGFTQLGETQYYVLNPDMIRPSFSDVSDADGATKH